MTSPNLPIGSLVSYRYKEGSLGIILARGKDFWAVKVAEVKWLHNKPITACETVPIGVLIKIL